MEKALQSFLTTLFPRGYYSYPPPLIAVRGIFVLTLLRQLKSEVTQSRFSLCLTNYTDIYRNSLIINALLFCRSPHEKMRLESSINLDFLVCFESEVADYFEHWLKNSGR